MPKVGTPRACSIAGIPYNVAADANISKTPRVMNEPVPHTGGNMQKQTLQHGNAEGITLILTPTEHQQLETVRDGVDSVPLSYTLADGSVYTCEGTINLDNYESEEARCDVTMIPDTVWTLFANS